MDHYEIEIFANGHTYDVIDDQKHLISAMTFRTDRKALSDWYAAHRLGLSDCGTYNEREREDRLAEWKKQMTELLGWESDSVIFEHVVSEVFTAVLIEEVKTS